MAINKIELKPGVKVGSLVLILMTNGKRQNGQKTTKWECICDCGHKPLVHSSTLSQGIIRHCEKCRPKREKRQKTIKKRETHGMGEGYTYCSYSRMISRCCNPKNSGYSNYGGRGITVCDRWLSSYLNFLNDMGNRPDGMFLDRIDNEKGYSPENCKWSSRVEQNRNRRNTFFVNFKGEQRKLAELIEEVNNYHDSIGSRYRVLYDVVYARLKAGWDIEKALNKPVQRKKDTQSDFVQLHLPFLTV